ncbi:sensor histidine kinase [Crocinitomicaceae bacterium CZZ-1]|uniref:histidine kinase n=1 Tax=Taishania pollutisoli TaxID=2766479 RepID=A0A8J6PR72_9FLAO|nr:sensor histidine kinase [Taishania pollutisoli]MBC9813053.1 sensor histidine kinase [Taishania pollutisoli]
MNKKGNILLLFSCCFLILLGLQVFYIHNSYQLEEKELNREARLIADSVLVEMEHLKKGMREDSLIKHLLKLDTQERATDKIIQYNLNLSKSTEHFNQLIDQLMEQRTKGTGFRIALKNEIYSINDLRLKKELLPPETPIVLYETKDKIEKGNLINEGKWNSDVHHQNTDQSTDEYYKSVIKSRSMFELLNVRSLIIQKIIPLCVISLSILIFLLYLFRKTLKNIELQNRKIAQLHTTIDSIAHELNTPITTLKFAIASVQETTSTHLLERQVRKLEHIVASIHTVEQTTDLVTEQEIKQFIQQLKNSYPSLTITATIQFNKNERLTKQALELILSNLVDNSSKYKANNVEIRLSFGTRVELLITDDGMGIPKEEQQHVFEKYYRISRTENHEINGLGVGLYLVKNTVERYNGTVEIISGSGKGTTFKIALPNEK